MEENCLQAVNNHLNCFSSFKVLKKCCLAAPDVTFHCHLKIMHQYTR